MRRNTVLAKSRALVATFAIAAAGCAGGEDATRTTGTSASEQVAETATSGQAGTSAEPGNEQLSFQGEGDTLLPPIRVMPGGGVLLWTNDGEVFSLFGEQGTLLDSVDPRGRAVLEPGLHTIEVIASGRWSITISGARPAR